MEAMAKIEALPDHQDEMLFKLKTRLFVGSGESGGNEEEVLSQYVRCLDCHAILT